MGAISCDRPAIPALSCASGMASIVPFSSLAKSAAPSAGTADAAAPSAGMGVAAEEKSSALRLVSMFTSDISCPLHPAIARQGRQLVLPPFLQVRAGAILELPGDFAIRSEEHTSERQSLMRPSY